MAPRLSSRGCWTQAVWTVLPQPSGHTQVSLAGLTRDSTLEPPGGFLKTQMPNATSQAHSWASLVGIGTFHGSQAIVMGRRGW